MAKATAHGKHEVYAWNTEIARTDNYVVGHNVETGTELTKIEKTLTRERWILRSDNKILHKIVWQKREGQNYYGKDGRLNFSSTYIIRYDLTSAIPKLPPGRTLITAFTSWLHKHGYTIVGSA